MPDYVKTIKGRRCVISVNGADVVANVDGLVCYSWTASGEYPPGVVLRDAKTAVIGQVDFLEAQEGVKDRSAEARAEAMLPVQGWVRE